jgi:murein DD-endopeptidase MepM/ murein hydrolase activator NlpD
VSGPVSASARPAAPVLSGTARPRTSTPVSASPAVAEAAALPPESGPRPGGARRLPEDDPQARLVIVRRGESLYDISRRHSVNLRALIETNRLSPPYDLEIGRRLYLPPPNVHRIEPGETLYSVSRRFNVDTRSLAVLNGLERPWTVWPGDEILLPPLARDMQRSAVSAPAPTAAIKGASPRASAPSGPRPAFIWPVSGRVLFGFGTRPDGTRNEGLDLLAPKGGEVTAAAEGEVVYVGDDLAGLGNLVLVRHEGGWVSAYARLGEPVVREGQRILQGQILARAPDAGGVHFEIRKGGDPVDPASLLPSRPS